MQTMDDFPFSLLSDAPLEWTPRHKRLVALLTLGALALALDAWLRTLENHAQIRKLKKKAERLDG